MNRLEKAFALLAIVLLDAAPVLAGTSALFKEYHTYGGTADMIADAFHQLSLIMSSSSYQGAFFGIAVLAFVIGGIYTVSKQLGQMQPGLGPWILWFGTIVAGLTVYLTFIRPTDTMFVYDETTNETINVADVPDGVITVAGFFNDIERGLIDLIDASGLDGLSYKDEAGGIALSAIQDAFSGSTVEDVVPAEVRQTITRYTEDCIFFEMMRPGTTLKMTDFYKPPSNDLASVMAQGKNPAIYTIWYSESHPEGLTVNCDVAWSGGMDENGVESVPGLSTVMNNLPVDEYYKQQCAAAGFNIDNSHPFTYQTCKRIIQDTLGRLMTNGSSTTFTGGTLDNVLRNKIIAKGILSAIGNSSPSVLERILANQKISTGGTGMGLIANDYIPVVKAAVLALFLGMLPFILLLAPTPLLPRVVSTLMGGFFFISIWGVADALVNSLAMKYALKVFANISGDGLGLANMILIPNRSVRALAMFGYLRTSAILFAGLLASMLFKFGGIFMSGFASRMVGGVAAAGASAGETVFSPAATGSLAESTIEGPTKAIANSAIGGMPGGYGAYWSNAGVSTAYNKATSALTGSKAVSQFGGGSILSAAQRASDGAVQRIRESIAHSNAVQNYARSHNMSVDQATGLIAASAMAAAGGSAVALNRLAHDLYGNDSNGMYKAMDFLKDTGLSKEYGGLKGLQQAYENAKSHGFKGDLGGYVGMMAAAQTEKTYANTAAAQEQADKFYGGDLGAYYQDMGDYEQGRMANLLDTARKDGWTPESFGAFMGHYSALSNIGRIEAQKQIGDKGVRLTSAGEQFNEAAKMVMRQALTEIGEKGEISKGTMQILKNIAGSSTGAAQLLAQGIGDRVISKGEAANFARWFRKHGVNVSAGELAGATAQMSFATDRNGNLHPSLLVGKKGDIITQYNGERRRPEWSGTFGNSKESYTFLGAQRIDRGNGYVDIQGVTTKGQVVSLVGKQTPDGKQDIISAEVKQGPKYNGAVAMAEHMEIPKEVLHNKVHAIGFANSYAGEVSKFFKGSLTRRDAERFSKTLSGNIGGNLGLPGIGRLGPGATGGVSLGGRRGNEKDLMKTSEKDIVASMAYSIATSNMTDNQKRQAFRSLNDFLIETSNDANQPKDLPGADAALHRGKNPDGEIRADNGDDDE